MSGLLLNARIQVLGLSFPAGAPPSGPQLTPRQPLHAAQAGTEIAIAGPLCRRSQSRAVLTTGQMTAVGHLCDLPRRRTKDPYQPETGYRRASIDACL